MIFGLYFLFRYGRNYSVTNKSLFISGLFWGLAFECRYQIGLAGFALFLWFLVFQTKQIKSMLFVILGGSIILFLSIFIDYWLYQKFSFPPLNYLRETLLKSGDMFGVSPWYDYVIQSQNWFGFPFGILAIGLFILILIKLGKSPFAWIFISFIVFHSFIGHKEIRFLFPVFYLIPILIAELIPAKWLIKQSDFYQETFKNALMLILILSAVIKSVFTSVSYASPDLNTFRTLNKIAEKTEKITVFCPYNIGYVMAHYYEFRFFRNDKINLRLYTNNAQLMAQNPHKENEYVLVWDHITHWPAEQGMMMVYKSITSIQKSFIYRGSSWNRDEYTIYKAKN